MGRKVLKLTRSSIEQWQTEGKLSCQSKSLLKQERRKEERFSTHSKSWAWISPCWCYTRRNQPCEWYKIRQQCPCGRLRRETRLRTFMFLQHCAHESTAASHSHTLAGIGCWWTDAKSRKEKGKTSNFLTLLFFLHCECFKTTTTKKAVEARRACACELGDFNRILYLHTCTVDHINIIYHTSAAGALSRKKTSVVSAV